MFCLLLVLVSLHIPFADKIQEAYAQQDAEALRSLLAEADSRADSLLVRYRLYPLTENAAVVENLPETLDDGTAREWALLSGLWSYRAGEASIFNAVTYGRRSANILETARSMDANDPYVLLIGGQSLLFRPAIAGRDPEAAADRFSTLLQQIDDGTVAGISRTEARVWKWLAMRESGRKEAARTLKETLLSDNPAPLYQQFLEDPPDV